MRDLKATLLLTKQFYGSDVKPLSQCEYNKLAKWLMSQQKRPGDLLEGALASYAAIGCRLSETRLRGLLGRGVKMSFALEEWERLGVKAICRGDAIYPKRLKEHLGIEAPAVLFCIGNLKLLEGGGLAIVGSRNTDEAALAYTRSKAIACARKGVLVVSGGARGIDTAAMDAALATGGSVIGVLCCDLVKRSLTTTWKKAIAEGRLLLISECAPDAGFTVAAAMSRNKLIYAMADKALVVSSEEGMGGTWAGVTEEFTRKQPRPIYVRSGKSIPAGNVKLLEMGALPL